MSRDGQRNRPNYSAGPANMGVYCPPADIESGLEWPPATAAQGLERNFDNALAGAVFGFPVRRRNCAVPGWRRRRGGSDLAFLQGLAGLFAASGLRAAGDDARACVGWRAAWRILQGAAAVSADPGGSENRDQHPPPPRRQKFL